MQNKTDNIEELLTLLSESETKRNHLESILEAAGESIVVTDLDGTITYVNPAFTALSGYTSEEVIGKNPRILKSGIHKDEIYSEMWRTALSGKTWRGEIKNRCKDGSLIDVMMLIAPVRHREGKLYGLVATHIDISEEKQYEKELIEAKNRAENATELKDKFVSLVSHDLRSPIASILELLNFMENKLNKVPPPIDDLKDLIKRPTRNCEVMIDTIDKLLNITMLKTGKITPNRKFYDLHDFCGNVRDALYTLLKNKDIEIKCSVPRKSRIYADYDMFSGVVMNLVTNALKFTNRGGKIDLFVPEGKPATLAVQDTGVGISKSMLPDIFKHEIKTCGVGTEGERGTGLGLPLCRDMMEAHGGEITVESEEGKGSTFYAELPKIKPLILIVDDSDMVRALLKKQLDSIDVEFMEAKNGIDALRLIEEKPPHLIIADYKMPVMDGLELVRNIRKNPKTSSIPLIVVTSDDNIEVRENAFRLGANDFVTKPIDKKDIIPRVNRFL